MTWKAFVTFWILSLFGAWCLVPYIYSIGVISGPHALAEVLPYVTIQAGILFGLALLAARWAIPKTDLFPFRCKSIFKKIFLPGALFGISIGLLIAFFQPYLISSSLHIPSISLWPRLFASFYGGINEEILARLFLFTTFYLLLSKSLFFFKKKRLVLLWITNFGVSLAFAIGHFPLLFKITNPSSADLIGILLLNFFPSLAFGWLYWSYGIYSVMLAHFFTDLIVHTFFM